MMERACIFIPNERADAALYAVKLIKVDGCDRSLRLAGAIFDLLKYSECEGFVVVRQNLCTDDKGEVMVSNLTGGRYRLIERCAPAGYAICRPAGWGLTLPFHCAGKPVTELVISNCRCGCRCSCNG